MLVIKKPMRRLVMMGLFATVLAVAGCTSGSPTNTNSTKDDADGYDPTAAVSITWWTGQTADAETLAENLAKEYHAAHPNVTLNVSSGAPTTDDLLTKLSAGFTSGTYPDISYAYGSWATELGRSGRAQNLNKFVADPSVAWDEIPA